MPIVTQGQRVTTDRSATLKDSIRAVASVHFATHGYDATGIRDIAKAAGVNPAIVIRHFESKERLFLESMPTYDAWVSAFDGPVEQLGYRLVRSMVALHESDGLRMHAALVQASGRAKIRAHLRDSFTRTFTDRIVLHLDGTDAELRAHMASAQIFGLATMLSSALDDEVLLAADVELLVEWFGRGVQDVLTGVAPARKTRKQVAAKRPTRSR